MTNEQGGMLAALAVMAIATYAMRAGGFWLMRHVTPTPRVERMLAALPGSIIAATVAPIILRDGFTAILAIGAALAAVILTRRDIVAVAAGMAVAAAARAAGF